MPNEEWGVKRICPSTGRRFYDLKKDPIISPYTGEKVTLDANTRTQVSVEDKKSEADLAAEEEDILLDDDDDGDAKDDDSLLDDDDEGNISLEEIKDVPAPGSDEG